MPRRHARLLALLAAALASACSDAPPTAVDAGIPPEVREHANDWPLPGRDYENTRATTDSAIDSSNVATLTTAWQTPLPGRGAYGNVATTPLIAGDTVYLEDLSSNTTARAARCAGRPSTTSS